MYRDEYLAIVDTLSGLRHEGEGDSATLDLVVKAFAATADVVTIHGFVNRIA